MRILFVTQIYLPEMGALTNRLYPLVRQLVATGHQVFVATGMPNYPRGIVFPEYRGRPLPARTEGRLHGPAPGLLYVTAKSIEVAATPKLLEFHSGSISCRMAGGKS